MHNTERASKRLPAQGRESTLSEAINNLRSLLRQIGRAEFRAYGYAGQLRGYRQALQADSIENNQGPNHAH